MRWLPRTRWSSSPNGLPRHNTLKAGSPGQIAKQAPAQAERASDKAEELERTPALHGLARAGIGARAVIYVVLAYIAVAIAANRRAPAPASGQGALAEVGRQPGGRPMLAVLALGLAAYALWRFLQAIGRGPALGHEGQPKAYHRAGWLVLAGVYGYLCGRAISLALSSAAGRSSGASSHPQTLVAQALRWPAGPLWVGATGVVAGASGLSLAVWGVAHDYRANVDPARAGSKVFGLARATGAVGEATRGLLVVLVAIYLVKAAGQDNPSQAKSLGQALSSFSRGAAGTVSLALAAAGLLCFAAFTVAEAAYKKL